MKGDNEMEVFANVEEAIKARREKYRQGIRRHFVLLPGESDAVGCVAKFLARQEECFARGDVPTMDFCDWSQIGFIVTFNMNVYYDDVTFRLDENGNEVEEPCVGYDSLDEIENQVRLRKLLIAYFTAGAAMAQRIGSKAYDDWAEMLGDLQFRGITGGRLFTKEQFEQFADRHSRILHRTWADNQVYKYNLALNSQANSHSSCVKRRSRKKI